MSDSETMLYEHGTMLTQIKNVLDDLQVKSENNKIQKQVKEVLELLTSDYIREYKKAVTNLKNQLKKIEKACLKTSSSKKKLTKKKEHLKYVNEEFQEFLGSTELTPTATLRALNNYISTHCTAETIEKTIVKNGEEKTKKIPHVHLDDVLKKLFPEIDDPLPRTSIMGLRSFMLGNKVEGKDPIYNDESLLVEEEEESAPKKKSKKKSKDHSDDESLLAAEEESAPKKKSKKKSKIIDE